jgi:hypothetical protein
MLVLLIISIPFILEAKPEGSILVGSSTLKTPFTTLSP